MELYSQRAAYGYCNEAGRVLCGGVHITEYLAECSVALAALVLGFKLCSRHDCDMTVHIADL